MIKNKMKKRLIILVIFICLLFIGIIGVFYIDHISNDKFVSQEKLEVQIFKDTASEEMRNSVLRTGVIDEIIQEKSILEGTKTFFVFTGTRNSIIGMSEYKEKVKIWVDKADKIVAKTEVVAQEEEKCQSDADCISGGFNGELCALKNVLPKLKLSSQLEEFRCYNLAKCRCINECCQWESNEEFNKCMKKMETDIKYLQLPF